MRKAVADPAFDATSTCSARSTCSRPRGGCRRAPVVFASTGGAIYGEGADRDCRSPRRAERGPRRAYGASKLAGEGYLGLYRAAVRAPGGRAALRQRLRPAAGPARRGRRGGDLLPAPLPGGRPPRVFGDGRQTRDYVYVGDVVAALLAADAALAERGADIVGPYNVGTGREVDVNELSRRLSEVAGSDAEVEHLPERPGEVRRVCIDASAADRDLGWQAHTDLTDGLRRTYEALASD